jgi:hypothetical protein
LDKRQRKLRKATASTQFSGEHLIHEQLSPMRRKNEHAARLQKMTWHRTVTTNPSRAMIRTYENL